MKRPRVDQSYQAFLKAFEPRLRDFVRTQTKAAPVKDRSGASQISRESAAFALAPGKRLRPYIAYQTAVVNGASKQDALRLAVSVELFHDFALVHDDVMDRSDTRRGRLTIHKLFEHEHAKRKQRGASRDIGDSFAILAGDLLFTWADKALHEVTHNVTLTRTWDVMCEEVILGQAMDVALGADIQMPHKSQLLKMLAVKSGRYSIGRPMMLGLALAGRKIDEKRVMSAAEPLGVAFQLQDDVLGTFGIEKRTGKSITADIQEGKMTLLAWETAYRLSTSDERAWKIGFGVPDASSKALSEVRRLMIVTGALQEVRRQEKRLTQIAIERISQLPFETDWLVQLALRLADRTS